MGSMIAAGLDAITCKWLASVLEVQVARMKVVSSRPHRGSSIVHLEVEYAGESALPRRLFLKLTDGDSQAARAEHEFYTQVAPLMRDPPVPRCFGGDASYLLLEDLTATHTDLDDAEAQVDCLAHVHGFWWNDARLAVTVGRLLPADEIDRVARTTAARFDRFMEAVADRMTAARRSIYERVIRTFPRPWLPLGNRQGLTLTHGDAHAWNFLHPRVPSRGRVMLVDWQLWHVHVGPRDLAYAMALLWSPEQRARDEQRLLRRYHEALEREGVSSYRWDDCMLDYRGAVIRNLFIPIWQWEQGLPLDIWSPNWEHALAAFIDLDCEALLG